MALVEKSNQNPPFRLTNGHRLSINLGNLGRFYTKKLSERGDNSNVSDSPTKQRGRISEESLPERRTHTRHNSISSTSSDRSTCKDSPFHMENEEVLVDVYNIDKCMTPSILLWKRSIGDSLGETEANYVHQPLCTDIHTQEIIHVAQLTDRRIVVVINDYLSMRTQIYVEYAATLNVALSQKSPKLVLKKMYHLVGLNFGRNLLAVYSHVDSELALISCKRNSVDVVNSACIFALGSPEGGRVKKLMFIHGSNELCLVTEKGIKIFSLSSHFK